MAIRAYVESDRLAALAGGDPSVVYPGFEDATPPNADRRGDPPAPFELQDVRPKTRAEYEANGWRFVDRSFFGYQPTHVLNLEFRGGGVYRATVCLGLYSVYQQSEADQTKYVSTVAEADTGELRYGDWQSVVIQRIELSDNDPRKVEASAPVQTPQTGPMPAPGENVFGRWFITGASTNLWGVSGQAESIETPELRQQCEAAMPDDAATRRAMATGFHDAPPPHGEPIPGWPAAVR